MSTWTLVDGAVLAVWIVLALAVCFGVGYAVVWLLFDAVPQFVTFLRARRVTGVGDRLCVPCGRATPSLLHRQGDWTCLVCNTSHPDPTRKAVL